MTKENFAPGVIQKLAFPERAIRGRETFQHAEDSDLIPQVSRGKVRLFTSLIPETQHLSQSERVGFQYFNALVFNVDNAIDDNIHIKGQTDPTVLEQQLRDSPVKHTDISIGALKDLTFQRFSPQKREKLFHFWTDVIEYHADLAGRVGEQRPGEYTYDDAVAYRVATNDRLVDTLCDLRDITDSTKVSNEKQRVFMIQLLDDAGDWKEDIQESTYNLFVGLANQQYPDELDLMTEAALSRAPEQEDTYGMSNRQFLRTVTPQTHQAYANIFRDGLENIQRRTTRLVFASAAKLTF